MNVDTLSSDSSEEEIRDSGRSFQSLIYLLIRLSFTHVARVINRHSQGVKTTRPEVTRPAKQCNYYNDTCFFFSALQQKVLIPSMCFTNYSKSKNMSVGQVCIKLFEFACMTILSPEFFVNAP